MVDVTARDIVGNTYTYSFMNKGTGKIAAMSLIQVSEVDNSNPMEKKGFIKTLQIFKDENITPTQITTDHHTKICKYMREKEPCLNHQFDVWHLVKNMGGLVPQVRVMLILYWKNR